MIRRRMINAGAAVVGVYFYNRNGYCTAFFA